MTIDELQAKENWTEEDYIHSLEFLRDNQYLAEQVYEDLDNPVFEHLLSFEAGWVDVFNDLKEIYKEAYQEAFKNI